MKETITVLGTVVTFGQFEKITRRMSFEIEIEDGQYEMYHRIGRYTTMYSLHEADGTLIEKDTFIGKKITELILRDLFLKLDEEPEEE